MNMFEKLQDLRPLIAKRPKKNEFSFEEEMLSRVGEPQRSRQDWFSGWLAPSYAIRVFLVACVWAIPGYLAMMILEAIFHLNDPAVAGTAGALFGAAIGGFLEKE
jgi:hypothetical protein